MAYLTCKNLTLGYEGHAIVSDLNFKVGKGDYLCIVGENGTGKSTLIDHHFYAAIRYLIPLHILAV